MTTSDEMGAFCHDHIEHPLMWCDEKKRLMERENAEESMRMWRRRKAEEVARKDRDKQEYYDMFLKHCPWGRPGGGAPNLDVRRKDITAVGLHSTKTIGAAHRITSLQPCRFSDYFSQRKKCHDPVAAYHHHHHHHVPPRVTTHAHTVHHHISQSAARPGAGSTVTICERDVVGLPPPPSTLPLPGAIGCRKNNGESLQITLKDHPSMSFRNKGHVDIEVRYKPTAPGKGKPMLEKIVVMENDKCPIMHAQVQTMTNSSKSPPQKKKLAMKMEKPPCKEPWGKAGPGGKPWRTQKSDGGSFMKSLGWTNQKMLKDLDQDNPATPAEKATFRKSRPTKKLQRCCEVCTCTCPSMITSPLKPLQKKIAAQHHPSPPPPQLNKGHNPHLGKPADTIKQTICPRFVRRCAGGGAPIGARGVGCAADNNQTTTENSANIAGNGEGVELVPLLARRRAINRPISLSSTDVTKRTTSHDRLSTAADLHLLHDLNTQMAQKRRSISVTQQLERELCNQHFETFDTFWGRPGHGAPSEIKNKLKLDNLLYGVQGCSE